MIDVGSAEDEIAIAEQFQVVCVIFFLYLILSFFFFVYCVYSNRIVFLK